MSRRKDHSEFLGFRKELAYGLRDGVQVSIRDVERGAACRCICPACGGELVAHKGDILVHHFAHAGSGESCGTGLETNAHLWAKQALGAHLWIRLPPLVAQGGGLARQVHRGQDFTFLKAELEKRAGEIVPDVELTARDGRRLIVEVLVTHACGPEKIARIRAGGVSAIEVDLSAWKDCDDAEEVAQALLTKAPRVWLFNPKLDEVGALLASEAEARVRAEAARQKEAGRRLVARIRKAPVRRPRELEPMRAELVRLGYGRLVGGARPGDGFVVPAHLWKAAALSRLVARALDGRPVDQVTPEMLLGLIRDCLWSDDRPPRQRASLDALRSAVPGFRPPSEAMQAFMDDLQSEGLLLYRKGDHRLSPALIERVRSDREARRAAAAAEAARLRREMDVQAGLERLFALAERPTEDDAFSLAAWTRNSPVAPGRSLADLVMAGDADWRALLSGLSAIERMLEGGALTDELLGLPFEERLEEARRQAAWIVAQERAAQEEAERRAIAGRMVAIREAAWAALNGEAEYWLSSPLAPGAACAIRTSEQSDEGLGAALGALRRHVAELEEAARKAVVIEGFQARLRQAAGASFEPARAEFFLNNRRPELGMATPLAYCVDERSLREAMSLLGSRSKR